MKLLWLNDENYFEILNSETLNFNLNPNSHYFQSNQISIFLYNYINNVLKQNIINKNNFRERYTNNNDCFIHIRLGDNKKYNPGTEYYLKVLKDISQNSSFDTLYIASDELPDQIVTDIIKEYKNYVFVNDSLDSIIKFASTNKHVILSHGSFSAIIGYLSFYSNVYYCEYENDKIWY